MIATLSHKVKTLKEGNLNSGPSLETNHVATSVSNSSSSSSNIVTDSVEGNSYSKKTQAVCTSCQHLYQNCEVVLTPASLCYKHFQEKDVQKLNQSSKLKLWKAGSYGGICICNDSAAAAAAAAAAGGGGAGVCRCGASKQNLPSRTTLLGPRFKRVLLIAAACLPFIFLIIYLVLFYL